ncbi:gelsolin-related protein of 125 kDa isoform X2 [Anabrus simplex]|uniref:gelsolin-related protein of 125 kDa isoform X2 n=1 Tax=Anabrus simplex TaxID=316456 RepID=UPI0035A265AF
MPQQCCVYKCNSIRVKGTFMQSFHRFPDREKSPTRFKLWERKINRQGFKPTKYSVVCSKHFDMDDFEETSLLKRKLIPTQKFQALLKKSAYPKFYLKGETEEMKPNSPLFFSYEGKNMAEEAVANKSQDLKEMESEEIDIAPTGRVPDFVDGCNEKGTKITRIMEEMVSIESKTVCSDKKYSEEVPLEVEYEPEPHVWVKEELLVKEEVQDTAPEETPEEQLSHSEHHPFIGDELEEVPLKAEYGSEPHVWVKEELLFKEEVQDAAPEENQEEQQSHSEDDLEVVKEEVESDYMVSDLVLDEPSSCKHTISCQVKVSP